MKCENCKKDCELMQRNFCNYDETYFSGFFCKNCDNLYVNEENLKQARLIYGDRFKLLK